MNNAVSTNANLRKVVKIAILWALCICLFYTGACWAIWGGGYFLTSLAFPDPPRWKPDVSDIVGKWQLSEGSSKQLQEWGIEMSVHEIEFRLDGTFKATNYPIALEWSEERMRVDFYTGTGTWDFDKMRFKPWSIEMYYDRYDEWPILADYYYLQGKEPPFKMYNASQTLVLEKK